MPSWIVVRRPFREDRLGGALKERPASKTSAGSPSGGGGGSPRGGSAGGGGFHIWPRTIAGHAKCLGPLLATAEAFLAGLLLVPLLPPLLPALLPLFLGAALPFGRQAPPP